MDQQNIDRLFREKLHGNEVKPTPNAWTEVEKQLGNKRKPFYYWIAASTVLFVISWVLWPQQEINYRSISAQEIDHPKLEDTFIQSTPIAAKLPVNAIKVKPKVKSRPKVETIKPLLATADPDEVENMMSVAMMEEESKSDLMEVQETKDTATNSNDYAFPEEKETPVYKTVKITYIASNKNRVSQDQVKADSAGVFKKFIAFTEKIDPGEMLADIKTAKDNLLNGGLKNKKDRTVMTP